MRFTLPENLLRLASMVVNVPDEPRLTVMNVGLREIEKSGDGMTTETVAAWDTVAPPTVALAVTVIV